MEAAAQKIVPFPEVAVALGMKVLHGPQGRAARWLRDRSLRAAAANVVVGERMADVARRGGADDGSLHVIHNWADAQAVKPGPKDNAFARQHGLVDRFVVMHSGNVGLSQNVDMLLDVAERLRDCSDLVLAIVGEGARLNELHADVTRVHRLRRQHDKPNHGVKEDDSRERQPDDHAPAPARRAARRTACTRLDGSAMPRPAMSKAVP